MRSPHNTDRWNMDDTPESADERECIRQEAIEREIDRADYLRDEMKDREMEEREAVREVKP
jgi:hypothetical protein